MSVCGNSSAFIHNSAVRNLYGAKSWLTINVVVVLLPEMTTKSYYGIALKSTENMTVFKYLEITVTSKLRSQRR
jgi:hypothetical protein